MTIKEKILDSIAPVLKSSSSVGIDESKIPLLAKKLESRPVPRLDEPLQFPGSPEEAAQFLFFLDSSQGCFWGLTNRERWDFRIGKEWVKGYYAFAHAIKKAFLGHERFFDALYLSEIPFDDFSRIFEGKNELLLLKERHEIIRENFRIIKDKYG